MTPERWQQIDHLFHSALARGPAGRTEFLTSACAGDEALRQEVESLLSSHEKADSFIEAPAGDIAAELLGSHKSAFNPGQQIENYRIVRQLGSGGMGEVYLADDTGLNRKVALKLLPPRFTVASDRVRRFEREARAASALNHPNIVTIYQIGQSNSAHFIATEFVDGKTLRELLNEKPLTLKEALNIAIQVAGALTGAHAEGIVHRDIKPENIMIRPDGYVKILDFGLAKLTELQTTDAEQEIPTLLQSNPGLVMGTVQYMSPEQARGKKVDARTDIWSLGVVLYELLTGHVPFSGETPSHVMVSLMEDELPPLTNYANVPAELDRIVTKALGKNQKDRYQTASALGHDLENLKEELQLEARLKGLLETIPSSKEGMTESNGRAVGPKPASAARTVGIIVSHRMSSAGYLVSEIKRHKTPAVAALLVLLVGAIGLRYLSINRNKRTLSASGNISSRTTKRGTTNEEAYRLYLQGKNLTNQRNAEDAEKAVGYFERAIGLDPNFARAYAGMANAYHLLGGLRDLQRVENKKAKEAVSKALELDNNLGEAYAVRGKIDFAYDWDFTASEKDLLRAIELEPNDDTAHWAYALLSAYRRRFGQALTEIETAQTIAPGTAMYERDRGRVLYYSRRYDEAIAQLKRVIELKENFPSAWGWLWCAQEMKGDYARAFESFIKWKKIEKDEHVEDYRKAYESAGWQGVKWKILEVSQLNEGKSESNSYELAQEAAFLREKDRAFAYLNKAFEKRQTEMVMLNVDPQLDALRDDPRFDELVRRVGLK